MKRRMTCSSSPLFSPALSVEGKSRGNSSPCSSKASDRSWPLLTRSRMSVSSALKCGFAIRSSIRSCACEHVQDDEGLAPRPDGPGRAGRARNASPPHLEDVIAELAQLGQQGRLVAGDEGLIEDAALGRTHPALELHLIRLRFSGQASQRLELTPRDEHGRRTDRRWPTYCIYRIPPPHPPHPPPPPAGGGRPPP